nr:MAG TPA: hypothetical protein [Caudoviricetes sp.]
MAGHDVIFTSIFFDCKPVSGAAILILKNNKEGE